MTDYEIYVFVLCLVVFLLLTVAFGLLIFWLVKSFLRLIAGGLEDKRILEEYEKRKKKQKKAPGWTSKIIPALFSVFVCVIFAFSLVVKFTDKQVTAIPQVRVVLSNSMQKKYEKNTYLFENNLNDQFSRFDLILTHKLPDEFDLKPFDIVVYEQDDTLIIHRIVKIEEPTNSHPGERWFWIQGDNVQYPDKFPVKYSQMKAIYKGQHIPYVGGFVAFLQAPAGILCVLYVLFGMLVIPALERKIEKEEEKRLAIILARGSVCPYPKGEDNGYTLVEGVMVLALPDVQVLTEKEKIIQNSDGICGYPCYRPDKREF